MINNIRITEVSYVSQKNDTLDLPVCPKSLSYIHACPICVFNYVAEVRTYSNSYFGDHPITYGMYFNCFGNETSLNSCQKSTTPCDFANVAGIYCAGDVVAGTVCMMSYLSNYKH